MALSMTTLTGCADRTGWTRTQARACPAGGASRVCLAAQPDAPVTVEVGDATLLPGECAARLDAHGRLKIRIVEDQNEVRHAWVVVRRSAQTMLALTPEGDVRVVGRRPCDDTVPRVP